MGKLYIVLLVMRFCKFNTCNNFASSNKKIKIKLAFNLKKVSGSFSLDEFVNVYAFKFTFVLYFL